VTAYAAFSSRAFRYQLTAVTLSMFSQQMLSTVVGWDLYLATRSPVVLGNVGLVQIIPVLLFTFAAGHVADRYPRRQTSMLMQVAQTVVGIALALAAGRGLGVALIYTCLFLVATARAFQWPATSAMLPQTVAPEHLTNAISWSGSARELATVGGPALAGILIATWGSEAVYIVQAACCALSAGCFYLMHIPGVAWAAITEADLRGNSSMYLINTATNWGGRVFQSQIAPGDDPEVAITGTLPHHTAWRVLLVGDEPGALIESNAITSLNPESEIKDTSWIHAGLTAWDWWSGSLNA